MPDDRHVFPVGDLIEHELDFDECVCGPEVEFLNNGNRLIKHHSLDGREFGVRLPGRLRRWLRSWRDL